MSSTRVATQVLLTIHGRRLTISTWVLTLIPGSPITTGFLLDSCMAIHHGIILMVFMATIHRCTPHIITILIIRAGVPITDTARTMAAVSAGMASMLATSRIAMSAMVMEFPATAMVKTQMITRGLLVAWKA